MSKQRQEDELDFTAIDIYNLDVEWKDQPGLYNKYAKKLARAKRRKNEAENRLKMTEAEVDRQIRLNPLEYFPDAKDKPPEKAIDKAIVLSDHYKAAYRELIEANYEVDILQGAVTALDHRKRALEKEVDLFLANYFTRPTPSERSKTYVDKSQKRLNRNALPPRKKG